MVELTEQELLEFGKNAAKLSSLHAQMKNAFDHQKKDWTGKLEEKQNEIFKLLHAINAGEIEREVECTIMYDFNSLEVHYVTPQGELAEKRPMRDDERQLEIARTEQEEKKAEEVQDAQPVEPEKEEAATIPQ